MVMDRRKMDEVMSFEMSNLHERWKRVMEHGWILRTAGDLRRIYVWAVHRILGRCMMNRYCPAGGR